MKRNIITTVNIIIIVLLLISIFPVEIWPNSLIGGGDVFFPVNFEELIKIWGSSWIDQNYLGIPSITYVNLIIPFLLYGALLQLLGVSIVIIQKLWILALIWLASFSVHYLLRVLNIRKSISIVPAMLLYVLSPFHLDLYNPPQYAAILSYSLLPLYLALFIKGVHSEKKNKYILYFTILLFFSISATQNLAAYFTCWISIVLYFFLNLVNSKFYNWKADFTFLMKIIAVAILINSFWIIQLPYSTSFVSAAMEPSWVIHTSINSKIINVIRMVGSWNFWSQAFDSPLFPYSYWYRTPIGILMGISIFVFSSSFILFASTRNKTLKKEFLFFYALMVISIFLAKGSSPPFGEVYLWMYTHIPFFKIFRESFTKFTPLFVLSVSVLTAYSVEFLTYKIKKPRYSFIVSLIISLIIVQYGWPFFTGDVIPKERGNFPGRLENIPDYWISASKYINNYIHGDSRILLLPKNPFYQMHYFWWGDGYYGEDPTRYLIFKPLVSVDPHGKYIKSKYSNEIINDLYNNYLKDDFPMWKALAILNVKYILYRKDLDWTHIGKRNSPQEPKVIKNRLQKEPYLHLVASFGRFNLEKIKTDQWFSNQILPKYPYLLNESVLEFYEVCNNYTLPHIYASNKFTLTTDINTLFDLFKDDRYDPRETIVFPIGDLKKEKIRFLMNLPEFKRYNNITETKLSKENEYDLSTLKKVKIIKECEEKKLNNQTPYHPKLTFKKVNPTKYIVSVENATHPFFLVFSESYHPQWKLYIEDRPVNFTRIIEKYPNINVEEAEHDWYKFTPGDIVYLFRKPSLNETYHFKANGYANAWYINPEKFDKDGDGKFTITIYFWPQSLFYLGLFISGTTLFGCVGYLFYDWRRERGDRWTKKMERKAKEILGRLKR